ncbi:MAG: hypothetical protein KJ069_23225 [Anaerolineae bacterium]|nr:hypothetical protein [Anaerolineae bacterium]
MKKQRGRVFQFVLLCLLALVLIQQQGTLRAQDAETGILISKPVERPFLSLTANNITTDAALGETLSVLVAVTNTGNIAASDVTIIIDGGSAMFAPNQSIGDLPAGGRTDVVLPVTVNGRSVHPHPLHLAATASNQVVPAQANVVVQFQAKDGTSDFLSQYQLESNSAVQIQVMQEQRWLVAHATGTLHTFRLAAEKPVSERMILDVGHLITTEISPDSLHLIYHEESGTQPTEVAVQYDSASKQISFTPPGSGLYKLEAMNDNPGEEPASWVPTFNPPTVSLFSGSVSYQYPILIPPGVNGLQPSLSLNYNSGAGSGLASKGMSNALGFGWSLGGDIEISQAVSICEWNVHSVCPANAYWGEDDHAHPGVLEFTLTIGGTGYEIVHANGEANNGYPGQYYVIGNPSVYVEYCRYTTTPVCLQADTEDTNPADGSAENLNGQPDDSEPPLPEAERHISKGYWVVKSADNTLYRIGYWPSSEQGLRKAIENGSQMGPWAAETPYAHALRWRVDKAVDRFSNTMAYQHVEFLPSDANPSWSNNQVHSMANYLTQIDYGFARIALAYGPLGDTYGIPPYDWFFHADSVSWQTHRLHSITVSAQNYESGSGAYNVIRTYELAHSPQRHGHSNPGGGGGITNQSNWCKDHYTPHWEKLLILNSITEKDANGHTRVQVNGQNVPEVEFSYYWHKTGYWADAFNWSRFCAPYLSEMQTANGATVTYAYDDTPDDDDSNHYQFPYPISPANTTRWINTVWRETVSSNLPDDVPQRKVINLYNISPYFGGKDDGFQGFPDATQNFYLGDNVNHTVFSQFEIYHHTSNLETLNGRVKLQTVNKPDGTVLLGRTETSWSIGGAPFYIPKQDQVRQYSTYYGTPNPYDNNVGQLTKYLYDGYGNVTEVRDYGGNLAGTGNPLRTQYTHYLYNSEARSGGTNWLLGLPRSQVLWEGLPDWNHLERVINWTRTRYDNKSCADTSAPTNGLATHVDHYLPGGGNGICNSDWLTSRSYYGENGNAWWQLSRTVDPEGRWQKIYWQNAAIIDKTENVLGITNLTYADPVVPWAVSVISSADGSGRAYDWDSFGRLNEVWATDPVSGLTSIMVTKVNYEDSVTPLYIDQINLPVQGPGNPPHLESTTRTFYDALGLPLQQRSWGMSSDINVLVTDSDYDGLGRAFCQTVPFEVPAGNIHYYSKNCADQQNHDQTITQFTPLGGAGNVIGVDDKLSMSRVLGRTSIGVDPLGHINVTQSDALGRLTTVEEFNTSYNAFANGSFDNNPTKWTLVSNRANPNATIDGQPALKVWGNVPWESVPAKRVGYPLPAPGGVFFRFRLDDTNFAGRIGLHLGPSDNGFIGLGFFNNKITPDYRRTGDTSNLQLGIAQTANVWYRAQMTIDPDGRLTWRVWQEDKPGDPDHQFTWTLDNPVDNTFFKNGNYSFFVHAGSDDGASAVYISDYREASIYTTTYGYDLGNNLTDVWDAHNNHTIMEYNRLGQKIEMNDPDMGGWYYDYDGSGNLIRQTDAQNQRLCFYYDAASRLSSKYHQGSGTGDCTATPSGTVLANHSYYAPDSGQGQTRLQSITSPAYTESFAYDWRGRPTSHTRIIDGLSFTMAYNSYDLLDRPLQMTYPDDEIVTMTYDRQFAETLQAGPDLLVSNLTHNEHGRLVQLNRSNGVTTQYNYYSAANAFRLQTIQHGLVGDALPDYGFTYDAIGNIRSLTEHTGSNSQTQTFTYDSLNRLLSANASTVGTIPGYGQAYGYDAIGNLRSMGGQTYNYDSNKPHAVDSISGGQTFTYDANGNMITRTDLTGSYNQTWDVENRLASVNQMGVGTSSFAYDVGGIRLKTTAPDGSVTYYPFANYEEEHRVQMVDVDLLYVSSSSGGTLPDGEGGTFSFSDEDILRHNPFNDQWELYFDGSAAGIGATDINAFIVLEDGNILMSFEDPIFLSGLNATVDDSDIVRYIPETIRGGGFQMYMAGSDMELTTDDEDVDALGFSSDGKLLVSTQGGFAALGISGNDEDLIAIVKDEQGGGYTASLYLDGSDVGLNDPTEDIWGSWVGTANDAEIDDIYLTTEGAFAVGNLTGDGADIFICRPLALGDNSQCDWNSTNGGRSNLYWDGSAHNFGGQVIDGFSIERTQMPGGVTIEQRATYSLGGQVIAQRTASTPANPTRDGLRFLHSDHLGSATAMSSSNGAYVPSTLTRFLPFGGYRTAPTADLTELGFTGHHENREIGLTYMNARFYLPGIGRFASADTIVPNPVNPQSHNRFSYVRNNPILLKDPSGHFDLGSHEEGYNENSEVYRYYRDLGWSDDEIITLFTTWETQYAGWWGLLLDAQIGDYIAFETGTGDNLAVRFDMLYDGDMRYGPRVQISLFSDVGGEFLATETFRLDHVLHGLWDWDHETYGLAQDRDFTTLSRSNNRGHNMLLLRKWPVDPSRLMYVNGTGDFSDSTNPMPEIDFWGTVVESAGWFAGAGALAANPADGPFGEAAFGTIGFISLITNFADTFESRIRLSPYVYPVNE